MEGAAGRGAVEVSGAQSALAPWTRSLLKPLMSVSARVSL